MFSQASVILSTGGGGGLVDTPRADGTHPTGMYSCFILIIIHYEKYYFEKCWHRVTLVLGKMREGKMKKKKYLISIDHVI